MKKVPDSVKNISKKNILSYKEFFFLCFSAPAVIYFILLIEKFYPNFLLGQNMISSAMLLQGCIVVYFLVKRNPNIDKELRTHTNGKANLYLLRFYIVAATMVLGNVVFGIPLYILLSEFTIF